MRKTGGAEWARASMAPGAGVISVIWLPAIA